jgi:hypothetical protein
MDNAFPEDCDFAGGSPEEEEEDIVGDDLPDLTRRCINMRRRANALLVTAAAQWSARRIPRSSRESHCRSGPRLGFFLTVHARQRGDGNHSSGRWTALSKKIHGHHSEPSENGVSFLSFLSIPAAHQPLLSSPSWETSVLSWHRCPATLPVQLESSSTHH